jgi:hypothetical protein
MNFESLWEVLKTGKQIEIQIDKSQHRRIMRRFRYESHKDRGFRLACAELKKSYRFMSVSLRDTLTIQLQFSRNDTMPKKFLESYRSKL